MKTIFTIAASLLLTSTVNAGGISSGGGDNRKIETESAWFLGTEPVLYCMKIGPNFGKSEAAIDEDIQSAAKIWKDYITAKKVHSTTPKFQINLNLVKQNSCDGKQDITFYFGTSDAETEKQKATFENPNAFVHRVSYDLAAGRGKGFVWIAPPNSVYPKAFFPDWSLPNALHGMLLHEFGHIVGCDHVEGTIMQQSLTHVFQMIKQFPERTQWMLTHIDDHRELFSTNVLPSEEYKGSDDLSPEIYTMLTGRERQGKFSARIKLTNQSVIERTLTLEDTKGTVEFPLTYVPNSKITFDGDAVLFSAVRLNQLNGVGTEGLSYKPSSESANFRIKGFDGKEYLVQYSKNSWPGAPIQLKILVNGWFKPLFTATLGGISQ